MRRRSSQGIHRLLLSAFLVALACDKPEPLTAAKAQEIISRYQFFREPVYAEVPQRVSWSPRYPKDDYDEKSLRTFANLSRAGYVTVSGSQTSDTGEYTAKVTQKGFRILGTAPSMRGAVYRGRICEKTYDGIRNFQRHPTDPTVGHAELIWHYTNPTSLYPMFETKIDKPLDKPFASFVAFYYKDRQWKFDVTVRKTKAA